MSEIEVTLLTAADEIAVDHGVVTNEVLVDATTAVVQATIDTITVEGPVGPIGPQGPIGEWQVNTAFKLKKILVPIVAGAVTLNLSAANTFLILLNQSITSISFSNLPPVDQSVRIQLYVQQDGVGGHTMSGWPAGVLPADSIAPEIDLDPNMRSGLTLDTFDGGASVQLNFVGTYGPIV